MPKHWRPDRWENPHKCQSKYCCTDKVFVLEHNDYDADIYEAGADAMLKLLREGGNSCGGRVKGKEAHIRGNGVWVFIPDEEE